MIAVVIALANRGGQSAESATHSEWDNEKGIIKATFGLPQVSGSVVN